MIWSEHHYGGHGMVRTTLWWSQQQHDMVRTTLWWSQQQHDMVSHGHNNNMIWSEHIMMVTTT